MQQEGSITLFGAQITGHQRHFCCTTLPLETETHTFLPGLHISS